MRHARNKKWVGLLLALTLLVFASACAGDDDKVTTDNPCPTKAQVDEAAQTATDLREEADGKKGGAGKKARDEASQAEKTAENRQARFDSEECVSQRQASEEEAAASTTTTTSPAPTVPGDVTVEVNPESLREGFEGPVAADELAFGQEAVEAMAGAPEERGDAAHSRDTLRTPEQVTGWLNGGDPKAAPVRARVIQAITQVCGAEDVAVHMEQSQGWLLMVIRPDSQVRGTSYFVDGEMRFASSPRQVGHNDAYWEPVCTQGENQGTVVWNGEVRADCGNGGENPKHRINRPGVPPAPPVDVPPEPNEPPNCPPWEPGVNPPPGCPKHPQSFDDMQNGGRPVHGGGQEPQGNNGVDTGPTTDGNGNPIPEPTTPNPWNPPSGGGTPPTAPNPTPGGHGGTGSGGTTPGGSTCTTGGTCQQGGGGPSGPTVTVPGEGGTTGPVHDEDPGGF